MQGAQVWSLIRELGRTCPSYKSACRAKRSGMLQWRLKIPCTATKTQHSQINKYLKNRDFPGGPVVKNLPANAGDMGSIPGPGNSLMLQSDMPMCHNYWSPHTLQPRLCNKRSHHNEKPKTKSSPHTLQLGKDCTQQWKPSTTKTNFHFPIKMLKIPK